MQFPTNHTVAVYRLTRAGNKDAYAATPVITGLKCAIFPAGEDIVAIYGGQPSLALYEVYIAQEAVLENGDKLTSGADEYIIRGVPEVYRSAYINYLRVIAGRVLP
jgi:hypothetical protein